MAQHRPNLLFDILPCGDFCHGLQTSQVAICGKREAPDTLPPATAERSVTGRRMRRLQRAAFLHSVQVDHGIERLSRIRDHVEGPVPYAGESLPTFLNRINDELTARLHEKRARPDGRRQIMGDRDQANLVCDLLNRGDYASAHENAALV